MYDAAIVGGGLAGCSAAIALARRGYRVVLLEAGSYPRPKVCGEFLSPESVALLSDAGFSERLHALNPALIKTLRITAPDGSAWFSRFPAPGLGISRYALDEALAGHAASTGVDMHTQTRVNRIEGDLTDGFKLNARTRHGAETIRAAAVIAAYGRQSNLDYALNRTVSSAGYVGLKHHFSGPPLPEHIDLHVFRGGYCGMSLVEDGTTNVCLLVRRDVFQAAAGHGADSIARFIAWMSAQNPYLGRWLAQATPVYTDWLSIAGVSLNTKTPIEGDILLAGDAAGMIAPLAGDGMAIALHTGQLAASAVERYLRHEYDAPALLQTYSQTIRQTFAARLRLGRVLQSVMLRPYLLAPGLRLLNHLPAAGNWLIRHTRDLHLLEESL